MSWRLSWALRITDVLFLLYWAAALGDLFGLFELPAQLMYAGYREPQVAAWNWSFFPLDIGFSVLGLWAVRLARAGNQLWRPIALVSLVLTLVAGLMAVAYWTILKQFDPSWFLPNLALLIWPLFFLPGLVRETAAARSPSRM